MTPVPPQDKRHHRPHLIASPPAEPSIPVRGDLPETAVTAAVPLRCPVVTTPWSITLADALDLYQRALPPVRYVKRMRAAPRDGGIERFFRRVKTGPGGALSEEARAAATQRRIDHVPDADICEPCNRRVVYDNRQACSICIRCGNSNNANPVDTSFREGTQMHSPYLYKRSNHFR